jgi:FkbM family methyltransferase
VLERYRVDVVLDVGANRGQFATGLRDLGFEGHIVSIEPVPVFADALESAAADDDRWTVHRLALGSAEATVSMHVQRKLSSLLPSTEYGRKRFSALRDGDGETVEVPVKRLDDVLDELLAPVVAAGVARPRVFLKLDTQGFDLEAFRGAAGRLADIVALQSEVALLLIYEQMPRMPEAVAAYEAAGFEISGLFPVTRERDGRVIEFDCVMVRADAAPLTTDRT